MKRLVDLLRVNESRFTAIILGAMTIAAVINFNGQLGSGGGVPCLYDVYIIGILHVVDTFVFHCCCFIHYLSKGITRE